MHVYNVFMSYSPHPAPPVNSKIHVLFPHLLSICVFLFKFWTFFTLMISQEL